MGISTGKGITDAQAADFFLAAQQPLQRQYEALRAFFVEEMSSAEAAQCFGYSRGAFRVLCYQFRHDPAKRAGFFRQPRHGPQSAPARDRVRDRAIALRKRNLSVYDIQRELAQAGHAISINALSVLLREEGFARLPRRRDDGMTNGLPLSSPRPPRSPTSAHWICLRGRFGRLWRACSCSCPCGRESTWPLWSGPAACRAPR